MTESLSIWYCSKYSGPIFWWKTSPGQLYQLWYRNRTGISFTWSNQLLHACARQCPEIKLNNAIIKWKVSRADTCTLDFSYPHPFIPYEANTLKQSGCRQCFQKEIFFWRFSAAKPSLKTNRNRNKNVCQWCWYQESGDISKLRTAFSTALVQMEDSMWVLNSFRFLPSTFLTGEQS